MKPRERVNLTSNLLSPPKHINSDWARVHHCHTRETIESHLSTSQFTYRKGGNCTDALLSVQHRIHSYLGKTLIVKQSAAFFDIDLSKAFVSLKHELLC